MLKTIAGVSGIKAVERKSVVVRKKRDPINKKNRRKMNPINLPRSFPKIASLY
ncbi:hypothetical protein JCM17380_18580 [Desulfosporosinus burensis]